ncbi:MAG: hypothetical protein AAGI38_05365 [Bacteroidota bacterium]
MHICSVEAIRLSRELAGKPQAQIVVAVARRVVVAIGNAAVPRRVVPVTAPVHAVRSLTMSTLLSQR